MSWDRPSVARVWKAIELYIKSAYDAEPPSAIKARLETLRAVSEPDFYESAVFERPASAAGSHRYALRLGNRHYPHMKLVIDRAPDGKGHLFAADTHDQHCCPPEGSREHKDFCQLMEKNRAVAHAIESAWLSEGIPTFKGFLRADLARRSMPQ